MTSPFSPRQALDPVEIPLGGAHLIEASAGTGKTYTIATLFVRLVVERGLGVDEILVVTFTEAAAAELRDRIRKRLRDAIHVFGGAASGADPTLVALAERRRALGSVDADRRRLELAVRTFDEAAISTIHGFCQRVLHDSAFETGVAFDTELIVDPEPLIDTAVRDFWTRELYAADPMLVAHLARRVGPAKLARLGSLGLAHLDAPVVPQSVLQSDDADAAAFVTAFRKVQRIWRRDAEEIQSLLLGFEGLNKRTYDKAAMPAWFQAMDAFLRSPDPGSSLTCPGFDKFLPEALSAGTKKEYRARGEIPSHRFFDACAQLHEAAAPFARNFDLQLVDFKRRAIAWLRREIPRRKRAHGVQSFDDLLHDLDRALRRRSRARLISAIRKRYRAALIDEFQDTDPVQYRIFHSIYANADLPLFLIGDPKQAIYGFRGADVFAYIGAAASVGRARYTMDRNWRSDPALLAAIGHLFDVRRPFMLEEIDFVPVGPRPGAQAGLRGPDGALAPFEILFARRDRAKVSGKKHPQITTEWAERTIPERIAAHISELLRSRTEILDGDAWRPVHAGDIAVLVRKNAQAQQIQAALRRLGIPGVVYGDASVFKTPQSDELLRVLTAIAEPTHSGFVRAAVTTELLGVTGGELERMNEDDTAWGDWVDAFRRWHRTWVERGFIQMFRALLVESGAQRRMLGLLDGERRMTNLLHLAELLQTASTAEHLGPAGLLRWFQQQRAIDYTMAETVKLRLERDDKAVQLITIHRSKGLEFPVVYCPYVWDPDELRADEKEHLLFHDEADQNRLKIDVRIKPKRIDELHADPNVARARFENQAESLRLLYVALTRARHRCVVVWGAFYRAHHSAFGYLLHAPELGTQWAWDRDLVDQKIKPASDDRLLEWIEQRRNEHWSVRMLDAVQPQPWSPPVTERPTVVCRTPRAELDRWMRTSSFTQMTSRGPAAVAAIGRDRDEAVDDTAPLHAVSAQARVPLADFPRGAKAGNLVHEILEHLDFAASDDERHNLVRGKLRAYGYDVDAWADGLDAALRDVIATPLGDGLSRLADVPRTSRLDELEFLFPVADTNRTKAAVTCSALAKVFERHADELFAGYADRLRQLAFVPIRGFLRGFIDLVFEHEGRWYVVDYKSNHLGDAWGDYRPARLAEVMAHEHYVLQYHLYVVALVRHLRRRIPAFSYDRSFGGVLYLFLRGMSPARGPEVGIFTDRPPAARIEALCSLLDRAEEVAG